MEEDKVKAETEAAKVPVDSTTLQLHNLLYEKNHYVKAIRACLDFQTKYPGIELVPEEEFQRSAPADILEKTLAADASHDLMLKRLNFELVQVAYCYLFQPSRNYGTLRVANLLLCLVPCLRDLNMNSLHCELWELLVNYITL